MSEYSSFAGKRNSLFGFTGNLDQATALHAGWHASAMKIREAVATDAEAACLVMRRSIVELCAADHRDDPAILRWWLNNKNPESFVSWLCWPANLVLVAVETDNVLAVGCITGDGRVLLNYVSPDARFRGVSRAMLTALEAYAAEKGNVRCVVTSTGTARRLYQTSGYVGAGAPIAVFGTLAGYPMTKMLPSQDVLTFAPG